MSSRIHVAYLGWALGLAPVAISVCGVSSAYAAPAFVYPTVEQALALIFPGEKFVSKKIELSPEEIKVIEDKSGESVRKPTLTAWVSASGNCVLIDEVLGKHEFIGYAVGITRAGAVKDLEILDYRETYGYQVRDEKWRSQFDGKTTAAPLKLGKDIVNISGATLSSAHMTGGVRRMLQTFDRIHGRL